MHSNKERQHTEVSQYMIEFDKVELDMLYFVISVICATFYLINWGDKEGLRTIKKLPGQFDNDV